MINTKKYFFLLLVFSVNIFYTCAVQRSPGGGPLDRTPPDIIYTSPVRDSLNLATNLNKIEIRFSERMEQSSLNNHIYISPPLPFEMKWDGWKKIYLHLKDTLFANQTYVVAIGAGARDLQKNSMHASFQFAFSTGDYIDKGSISGRVYSKQKETLLHIFAYAITDTGKFNPMQNKPLYVSQSGADGAYKLDYLKMGGYRVLAVEDQNHNLLADADIEQVGIPFRDVTLDSLQPMFDGLDFQLTHSDTTAPQMLSVRSKTNTSVHVRLSEAVILPQRNSFILRDSLTQRQIEPLGFSKDLESAQTILLFTDSLDTSAVYHLEIPSLRDSAGNINDTLPVFSFSASVKTDTTTFHMLEHLPKDSTYNLLPGVAIRFKFSRPIDSLSLKEAYLLTSTGKDTIAGRWIFPNLFEAQFRPLQKLRPDSAYFSTIDLSSLRDLWKKILADSTDHHYFTIVSSRELGELSGEIVYSAENKAPVYLNIRSLKRGIKPVIHKAVDNLHFRIPYLKEGAYLIDGFLDLNHDGKFTPGKLAPFEYSEPFHFSQDTIKIRKRWEKSGVQFVLPEAGK